MYPGWQRQIVPEFFIFTHFPKTQSDLQRNWQFLPNSPGLQDLRLSSGRDFIFLFVEEFMFEMFVGGKIGGGGGSLFGSEFKETS